MALGLHIGAHHAKAHHRLTFARQEGGDDGVKRFFARRYQVGGVGCVGLRAKAMPPVLQADAKLRLHAARTKTHVIALDKADHHAAFIGRSQVHRAALNRVASAKILRLVQVYQPGALGQILRIEQLLGLHLHAARVGDVAVDVGKSQLHGLDLHVLRVNAVACQARHVKVPQNAQGDQRGDALAVGRNLMQRVAPVVLRQRLDPLGLVGRQVRGAQAAAVAV